MYIKYKTCFFTYRCKAADIYGTETLSIHTYVTCLGHISLIR